MAKTSKELVEADQAEVPKVTHEEAQRLLRKEDGLLLDVREPPELEAGKAEGALHVPRGMLEFKADDSASSHEPQLRKDRPVLLYCAAGGRAALAGKTLKEMGFERVYNIGGFKDWAEAGGATEKAG